MSGSMAPRPGGTTRSVGGYDLTCEVTRGVFGTLWVGKAADATRTPAAALIRRVPVPAGGVKILDRLVEGAEWGRRGREPGLVAVADVVRERDEVAIVTPFVEGEPLRALLRAAAFKREFMGPDVALRLLVEVLEQLHLVHDRTKYDPMHRAFGGLQPDSIYVGTDGFVRLLDIGLGVAATQSALYDGESQWIAYLSPEQLSGGEATAASDVFTVGAMLWEMLANRRLFAGATPASVKDRVKSGPIQRLDELRGSGMPQVDPALATIAAKALERDPAMRFQSAAEMSDALRKTGKLAAAPGVAALVERMAEQFLDKRRALLQKVAIARAPLDGRTAFLERGAASRPPPAMADAVSTGGAASMAVLARTSSARGHTPPPPPSMRTSMPPPPPSMRPPVAGAATAPAGAGASRADRALALAKAASVAAAAPPPRSVPPVSLTPSPSPERTQTAPTASEAPRPPSMPAPAVAAPRPTSSAPPPVAVPRPASSAPPPPVAAPRPSSSAPPVAQSAPPIAPAPVVVVSTPPPAAMERAPAAAPSAPAGAAGTSAVESPIPMAPPEVLPGSAPPAPVVERFLEPAATNASAAPTPPRPATPPSPDAVGLAALGPSVGGSVANGMSPVVSSIAIPGTPDEDLDVPFAKKRSGSKRLWLGAAAAVAVLGIGIAVAGSGGEESPVPKAAAPVPVAPPKPERVVDPEPAPPAPATAAPAPAPAEPAPEAKAEEPKPEPPKAEEPSDDAKPSKKRRARAPRAPKASAPKVQEAAAAEPAPAAESPPTDVGAAFKPGGI